MDASETQKRQSHGLAGSFAYDGLDRVIHERARLGIMTSLVTHPDGLLFGDLKELCALTDGNLNRHLKVLVDAGWVRSRRTGRGRASMTHLEVTTDGLRGLETLQAWCGEVSRALHEAGIGDSDYRSAIDPPSSESVHALVDDHSRSWQG